MFIRNKTLEGIIAGFNKTVTDLEEFSSLNRAQAADKRAEADMLVREAAHQDEDAGKAERIRDNILNMLA